MKNPTRADQAQAQVSVANGIELAAVIIQKLFGRKLSKTEADNVSVMTTAEINNELNNRGRN